MTDREALAQITATLEKVKADAIENDWRLHRQTLLDVQGAIKAAAGVHLGDEGLRAALVDQINDEAARLRNAGMNHLYVAGVEDAARFVRDRAALGKLSGSGRRR